MNPTIAIYSSKNSEKVVTFCTGVNELTKYCSLPQAKKIQKAQENGMLYGVYFTKAGNVRATYI